MRITETKLSGVFLLQPQAHVDSRGFFVEHYNRELLHQHGFNLHFVQDNVSLSIAPGTIRGLHYQLEPKAQTKLISVLSGAIFDVVVDLRRASSTYGEWCGVTLSEDNMHQLLVPKGFAHGFCTLIPHTKVLYKVDELYSPENDRGILWNDPQLGIDWPFQQPILSEKDREHPLLRDAEINFG